MPPDGWAPPVAGAAWRGPANPEAASKRHTSPGASGRRGAAEPGWRQLPAAARSSSEAPAAGAAPGRPAGGVLNRPSDGGLSRPFGGGLNRPSGGGLNRPSDGVLNRPSGGVLNRPSDGRPASAGPGLST